MWGRFHAPLQSDKMCMYSQNASAPTQEQERLKQQQQESLAEYEEIKKELVADTAFVGALVSDML